MHLQAFSYECCGDLRLVQRIQDGTHAVEAARQVGMSIGITGRRVKRLVHLKALFKERAKTLVELCEQARMFLSDDVCFEPKAVKKFLGEQQCEILDDVVAALDVADPWTHEGIKAAFESVMAARELKLGKLAQPVRVALTGGTVSPGIFEVCELLGRDKTLARLRNAAAGARRGELPMVSTD